MNGRRVFITGAGRGLGAALALTLADLGAEVTLAARDPAALDKVANAIVSRSSAKPETIVLDLADAKAVTALTAQWRAERRALDILINNASMWQSGDFESGSDEDLISLVNANVTGTMLLTKGLLPLLKASPAADIITVVSVSGMPQAEQQEASVAFVASKAAQSGFTDALRQELRGSGVRITAIYPPNIEDISPLDMADWNRTRDTDAWVTNRDVVDALLAALQRGRHISFQSILIETATSNLHFHKD